MVIIYLGLSYVPTFGGWISIVGTGLIILFAYFVWPLNFKERIGILF